MTLRSRIILCLLSSFPVQAYSQEEGDREVNAIAETESQFLFINMLEFLGEFETGEGEWISPDILANDAFADLDRVQGMQRVQRVQEAQGTQTGRQQNVNLNEDNGNRR